MKFTAGERWVFYSLGPTINVCDRALGRADPGSEDLLFLRGLPRSARGTRLSGSATLYEETRAGVWLVRGIANAKVTVIGGRRSPRETRTNAAGAFEMYDLAPGKYSVRIDPPKGFTTDGEPSLDVQLPPNDAASAQFVLSRDTRIAGRVFDAQGLAKKGVRLDLVPIDLASEDWTPHRTQSGDGGGYVIPRVPPGKYWLMARTPVKGSTSESLLYYPGVRDRRQAKVVSIEAGDHLESLDVRMPAEERRYRIAGRVQFANGKRADYANVVFSVPESGFTERMSLGPDGSFLLPVIAGMRGNLRATYTESSGECRDVVKGKRDGPFYIVESKPIVITVDRNRYDVVLTLPVSCAQRK